jgi:NADH:ubiquinone oxidoreductase subunit F (NADH-binding)/NADH:ubiquinone oxidoreductase subunit E
MIVQELHKLQAKHGHLPRHELVALGERLAVPLYRIQEVVSFFPHYRTAPPAELEIHVCQDMACHLRGSAGVIEKLALTFEGQPSRVKVCGASCLGRCDRAPAARIYDNRHQQSGEHPVYNCHGRTVQEISAAAEMLIAGQPASLVPNDTDLAWQPPQKDWQIDIYAGAPAAEHYASIRWFLQTSTKASTGTIDGNARAAAVQTILGSLKTAWLLGLGGAGGRAYKKWEETLKEHQKRGEKAYVVCNGDESEPATFKDRELFLRTPHLVVEGVTLAGLLLGATKGYIYIRHEYEEQITAVREEIKAAEAAGLCGEDILGSGLNFPVEVFVSPGGYICGEQTALIEAIQDSRAEPRNRPPELQTNGLWDMPTLLSNVETFAWVPAIVVRDQGKWFQEQGQVWNQWTRLTAKLAAETGDRGWTEAFNKGMHFKGRRFFSVSGDVERPGAYEVPIGITLGELIATCGGMRGGEALKAVALSGPSGGFLPRLIKAEHLSGKIRKMLPVEMKEFDLCELQLDMNLFRQWGLMLGAGITIYGESADLVEQAYSASHFYARESCGKCVPCRIGSTKIAQVAGQLRERKLTRHQIDELFQKDGPLLDLAGTMSSTAICGLGQIAANPLMSLLRYFPDEAYAYATQS